MVKAPRMLPVSTQRRSCGTTIVELLIATLIASLLGTLALATLMACIKANTTNSARVNVSHNIERALDRLQRGIRSGTNLGDVNRPYGIAERWVCDNDTLVVQVPVMNSDGFTTTISDPVPGDDPVTRQNVETLVYEVVPNPSEPGTYLMQMTRYAGAPVPGYTPPPLGTQTFLTGIIGPMDTAATPKIFQYVDVSDPAGTVHDTMNTAQAGNYKIVVVNVETVQRDLKGKALDSIAFKSEYYLHNCAR